MVYQVSFCLWLLTFEPEIAKDINRCVVFVTLRYISSGLRQYDIIPLLTEAAQSAVKEKVTRVILATFRVRFPVKSFTHN